MPVAFALDIYLVYQMKRAPVRSFHPTRQIFHSQTHIENTASTKDNVRILP
jgi:hypothetical protein